MSGTAWALSSSHNYNANSLLDFFDDPEVSKGALIEVLKVHKHDLSIHELFRRAYELETKEKAAVFKIIEDVATSEMVPDLINRMGGKDPVVKVHLIQLLSKFKGYEINNAFEMQLGDPNKMVRGAALKALARRDGPINIQRVAKLLHDPDLDVQSKAVDVIIKINHPETIKFLVADTLQKVLDCALQVHGGLGMTDDTPIAWFFRHERAARIYDGPDEVHKLALARRILRPYFDA